MFWHSAMPFPWHPASGLRMNVRRRFLRRGSELLREGVHLGGEDERLGREGEFVRERGGHTREVLRELFLAADLEHAGEVIDLLRRFKLHHALDGDARVGPVQLPVVVVANFPPSELLLHGSKQGILAVDEVDRDGRGLARATLLSPRLGLGRCRALDGGRRRATVRAEGRSGSEVLAVAAPSRSDADVHSSEEDPLEEEALEADVDDISDTPKTRHRRSPEDVSPDRRG